MIEKNAQERLAGYLAGYAADVVQEWMRIVEVDQDTLQPGSGVFQARATWHGDRTMTLGTSQYSDDLGTYRLVVHMQPIQVPPIGPEDDGAMRDELRATYFDPDNPGCAPEECGGSRLDPCVTIMRTNGKYHDGETCDNCAPLLAGARTTRVDGTEGNTVCKKCDTCGICGLKGEHDEECQAVLETSHPPKWVTTSWIYARVGDRVRLNGQEATVKAHSAQEFFADNTDTYRPKSWRHTEVSVELAHLPGRKLPFPPASAVEILMDRERQAIHLLQESFGATEVIQ